MQKDLTLDELRRLYGPPIDEFVLIDVPELRYFALDGAGSPDDPPFHDGIQWLFLSIHPIKLEARRRMGKSFVEPPLEALFWADDMADLAAGRKDRLRWRLLIPGPSWATDEMLSEGVAVVEKKRGPAPLGLRLESFTEGLCAQTLFVGPNESVRPTLDRLYHEFLPAEGLVAHGPYHEIYLSDPRRTAPAKRRTVLRQPVRNPPR